MAAWVRVRTPAEAAAREREGRGTLKREGEEDENFTGNWTNERGGKKLFGEEARKAGWANGVREKMGW